MRTMNHLILTTLLLTATVSQAGEFYPTPPARSFGSNQDTGSCQSESFVTSLEHKLAERGANFKISLQHAHAAIWRGKDLTNRNDVGLILTATSNQITGQYGTIVPDYVLPEDLSGVDFSKLGTEDLIADNAPVAGNEKHFRPKIEDMGIYDGTFPPNPNVFSVNEYTFSPGYSNSASAEQFFSLVKSGAAVALSFNSSFLSGFNPYTGLLLEPYATDSSFLIEADHSVAVVGYDDALDGITLRNTWNSDRAIRQTGSIYGTPEDDELLKKFRHKISARNLPGYYLFPNQFIRDLASRSVGGFRQLNLDYGGFANSYQQNSSKFEVINTFYTCTPDLVKMYLDDLKNKFAIYEDQTKPNADRLKALQYIKTIIQKQISKIGPLLYYGRHTRKVDGTIDRVKEFHEGKFANYYCGRLDDPKSEFWPTFSSAGSLEKFMNFERKLTKDRTDLATWMEFFKYLTSEVN